MKKYIYTILTALLLFASCYREEQMDRTVFIPDENDKKLPAYTEWGYNTFGAVYDVRNYFLVSNAIVPCRILCKDGLLRFSLSGVLKIGDSYTENLTLSFHFPIERIEQYVDLLQFNDYQINLKDENCIVKMTRGENERTLDIVSGILHFKRTQLLYIDDVPNRIILSGVFNLRFLENDFPTSISNGRFDLGINDDVFYAY